jgi:multidrug resistance protein
MLSPKLLLFFTVFLDLIGFGIVLPLLPSYAAAFKASETAIGFLVASFSAMQFLLAPAWGRWSDRVGRRPVLLIGLAGSTLSYLLFARATGFAMLLASRVLAGGMGATVNVAQAYLADLTAEDERAKAMGLIGAAFGLGFVFGPALGGLSSRWGEAAPGYCAAFITAINLVLAWRWLPETPRRHELAPTGAGGTMSWAPYFMPFSVMALTTMAFTVMYVIFPLEAEHGLGYSRHQVAYLFVALGLVGAVVQGVLVGRLVPRFGERRLMIAGALIEGGALVLLALLLGRAHGGPALVAILGLFGIGIGLVGPSTTGFVSRRAAAAHQGKALGLLTSIGAVARIAGPLIAGGVAQGAGSRTAFMVAAAAAAAAGLTAALPECPPTDVGVLSGEP